MSKLFLRSLLSLSLISALTACATENIANPQPSTNPPVSQSPVNECVNFVDQTAENADREIIWDEAVATDSKRCMRIKVGQSVTFRGNFTTHPLKGQNGDFPNPFGEVFNQIVDAGVIGQERTPVNFATPGIFGFTCSSHNSMMGAIMVIP